MHRHRQQPPVRIAEGGFSVRWKDYRHPRQTKGMTLRRRVHHRFCSSSCLNGFPSHPATTALSRPTVGAPPRMAHCAVCWRYRAAPPAPAADLPRALQAAHRRSLRTSSVLRRVRDRKSGVTPASTLKGGLLEQPHDPIARPHRAQGPENRARCRRASPAIASRYRRQTGYKELNPPSRGGHPRGPLISLPPMAATASRSRLLNAAF